MSQKRKDFLTYLPLCHDVIESKFAQDFCFYTDTMEDNGISFAVLTVLKNKNYLKQIHKNKLFGLSTEHTVKRFHRDYFFGGK